MKFNPSWLVAVLFLAACGPGEKTTELKELERILQDPNAASVKEAPGASKPYREARQFRRLAVEAWDEGNDNLSREYAALGTLRYRTAEAMADQVAAKERLDAANAKVATSNPEVEALSQERNKIMTEIAQLTQQVELARTQKNVRVQQHTQSTSSQQATDKRSAIIARLKDAETAQKAAEGVDAATHAPEKFSRALNIVKSVHTLLDQGQATDGMMKQLGDSIGMFAAAKTEAQPFFDEVQAKANPEERRAQLRKKAASSLGSDLVLTEALGARLILPELFATGGTAIEAGQKSRVTGIAEILKSFDEFTIFIEGYTSKVGNATENLGLSQNRARAVRDALTAAGIDSNRIEVRGYGNDRPRYPDNERNERVEIVVTRSN